MVLKHFTNEPIPALVSGLLVCFGLYGYSVLLEHTLTYDYLILNLGLALIPLLLSWRIVAVLRRKRWSSWEPLLDTILWLIFLPNSFYMISDYIHIQTMPTSQVLFNSIMFSSFIFLAMTMGIISLYMIHAELRRRIRPRMAAAVTVAVIAICCFAIYLGRDLRWNSWDIIFNPGGVLFDISNLILKPDQYPDIARTVTGFFLLIGALYFIGWQIARTMWHRGVNDLAAHIRKQKHT